MPPSRLFALEAHAVVLEQEIAALTRRLSKKSAVENLSPARRQPPAGGGSSGSGLLSFAASQARAQAKPEDVVRIEKLISDTASTSRHMQEALRAQQAGHARLIAEFGEDAVAAWKAEHAEEALVNVGARDQAIKPFGAFADAFEGGDLAALEQLVAGLGARPR